MTGDFDPMLDCYRSWEAFIAWLRARWLAGEPISDGPWAKPPIEKAGMSKERTSAQDGGLAE